MAIARDEFLAHIKDKPKIVAAVLEDVHWSHDEKWCFILYPHYTDEEYEKFLADIKISYDEGYGSQEVDGTIWFDDGSFSDRGEYDGSEWWEYQKAPDLPKRPKEQSNN